MHHDPTPTLVIEFPNGGRISHPVPPNADICDMIARLSPHVPTPSTWHIQRPNPSKVDPEPTPTGQENPA